jgi:hypothetical protein
VATINTQVVDMCISTILGTTYKADKCTLYLE